MPFFRQTKESLGEGEGENRKNWEWRTWRGRVARIGGDRVGDMIKNVFVYKISKK